MAFPLDSITNFNTHTELKPPEKPTKKKASKEEEVPTSTVPSERRIVRKHGDEVKALFLSSLRERLECIASSENRRDSTQNREQLVQKRSERD